ncbi:MAG TPA: hypothetical protein VGI86_00660 [Acidimicrobiia bacterium]|jgi:hypothetical protein
MSARGSRSFRYGARLTVTVPLALVFAAFAAAMAFLAMHSGTVMSVVDAVAAMLGALFAGGMGLAVIARVRGKRRIVMGKQEITAPIGVRGPREVAIRYRDIRDLQLAGTDGFSRTLRIRHVGGEHVIAGVMLGSTGELDEIHSLLKAASKVR